MQQLQQLISNQRQASHARERSSRLIEPPEMGEGQELSLRRRSNTGVRSQGETEAKGGGKASEYRPESVPTLSSNSIKPYTAFLNVMSHMAKFISDFASTIQEIDNAAMQEGAENPGSKSRLKKWNRKMLQNF